ncbi:Mu transposase C-terminal domain-containing protein [Deinococcus aquatilis]|uniref:Mu transposase C-terminal domain-containing protein n=1 Tax=Deinococcus aquatilis TaxID=519440 RepID=UPI00036DDA47|nr:Mu transposase C-terminal domain-containing protein [Deinococcus aquatilis]
MAQDLLVLVDADPRVRAVRPGEPVTFHRPSDGEPQTFTPDLEVEYDDGVHIIACRPWEALDRAVTQDELIWKILLEHYRNELVLHKLYILTPEDLPAMRVQQARHFAGFHGQPPHPEIHRATLAFLGARRGAVPLPELRRHLQEILIRPPDPEQISGTLYGMLGRGELAAEPGVLAPNCAVSRPSHPLPLPIAPLGHHVGELLIRRESPAHPKGSARASSPPGRDGPAEESFLKTRQGQTSQAIFVRYSDPTVPLTHDLAEQIAREVGCTARTVYRFREKLRSAGAPGLAFPDLIPFLTSRGKRGARQLTPEVSDIITDLTRTLYLQSIGHPSRSRGPGDLAGAVRKACTAQGLEPPSRSSVMRQVQKMIDHDPVQATRLREGTEAADRLRLRMGSRSITLYGQEWGMDCTPINVFLLQGQMVIEPRRARHRSKPSTVLPGAIRARIILITDVATGLIIRAEIVYGHVDAAAVLSVLRKAMLGEVEDLRRAGVKAFPPGRGLPLVIRMDSGREFKNLHVEPVLRSLGIGTNRRHRGLKHHGGLEERTLGTLTHTHHLLPGTTMHTIAARGDYKAKDGATLDYAQFEAYHQRIVERYNNLPGPLALESRLAHAQSLIEQGAVALRPLTESHLEYLLTRMRPRRPKTVQRDGIFMHGLRYTADALTSIAIRTTVDVAYAPEDIRTATAFTPHGVGIEVVARLPGSLEALGDQPLPLRVWEEIRRQIRSVKQQAWDEQPMPYQIAENVLDEDRRGTLGTRKPRPAPAAQPTPTPPVPAPDSTPSGTPVVLGTNRTPRRD